MSKEKESESEKSIRQKRLRKERQQAFRAAREEEDYKNYVEDDPTEHDYYEF